MLKDDDHDDDDDDDDDDNLTISKKMLAKFKKYQHECFTSVSRVF